MAFRPSKEVLVDICLLACPKPGTPRIEDTIDVPNGGLIVTFTQCYYGKTSDQDTKTVYTAYFDRNGWNHWTMECPRGEVL